MSLGDDLYPPEYQPEPASDEATSIIELAECVKEILRMLESVALLEESRILFLRRVDAAYKKAVRAKDRVTK